MVDKSIEEKFWSHVDKSEGCWLWNAKDSNSYGRFWCDGTVILAHRFAWELTNGPIPDGMFVCHHCDTPKCVRPDHLFIGTNLDNIHDMFSKGRCAKGDKNGMRLHPDKAPRGDKNGVRLHPESLYRGEDHYLAKTTGEEVIKMRALYDSGLMKTRKIANLFNLEYDMVYKIVKRTAWRHIK